MHLKAFTDMMRRFLWAKLLFNDLNVPESPTKAKVLKALKDLPENLDATYDRMLRGIRVEDHHEARTCLTWLAFAETPLTLAELADACTIFPHADPVIDEDQRPDPYNIWRVLSPLISVSYQGLQDAEHFSDSVVTWDRAKKRRIDANDLRAQLIHLSLKEYLISDHVKEGALSMFHLTTMRANLHLAQSCMVYFLHVPNAMSTTEPDASDFIDRALLLYAMRFGLVHQRRAEQYMRLDVSFEEHLPVKFLTVLSAQTGQCCDKLWLASTFGLNLTVQRLPRTTINDVQNGEVYGTPLTTAVWHGHDDTVKILLDIGASIDQDSGTLGTALQIACYKGREAVVRSVQTP